MKKLTLFLMVMFGSNVFAQNVIEAPTSSFLGAVDVRHGSAKAWNLSEQEWEKYKELMQGLSLIHI